MRKPEGHAIVEELIGKVDVLVENYAPGVIKRMGFDYDAVRALDPSITMAPCRPSDSLDRSVPSRATITSRRPTRR